MKSNRLPGFVAGLTALTMAPAVIGLGTVPAHAAPPSVPTSVAATTSVDTLTAGVLGVNLPPVGNLSAASIELGDVDGTLAGTNPRSVAHAANLDAAAVGLPLGGILSSADQEAPPDNRTAATAAPVANLDAAPLVTAGVSNSSAHARFNADGTCLPAGSPLTTSTTSTTDVAVVAVPGTGALLGLPGTVSTTQSVALTSTGGAQDARQVTARTGSNIAAANLFGSLQIGVSAPPQITASASGTSPATVTYNQPVVTVSGTGLPQNIVLDAANETAAFSLPENPLLGLELSLGALTKSEAADGTSASGSAALLNVRLFLVNARTSDPSDGVDVAEIDLVPMEATASAPLGGITCGDPSDTTAPTVSLEQPADGTSTSDTTPTASGTAEPSASIKVTDEDGTTVCTTTASAQGIWSCTGTTALDTGDHTFTATATDAAGNTATDTSTFTVDPASPAVDITDPAQGSSTNDTTPTASGTAEAGSTVVVTRDDGRPVCVTIATDGTWACTGSVPLGDGPHNYTATATDTGGNSGSDGTTFSVDTEAPDNPVITSPADGSQVTDTTPEVTGRGEPASTVTVRAGQTVICSAAVAADGTWSCTPETPLGVGSHTFTATATDAAGNVSGPASTTFTVVTVTTVPPGPSPGPSPGPAPGAGTDTDDDGLTDDEEVDSDGPGPDTGIGTNPQDSDSDGDGLADGKEVMSIKSDPKDADTDNDSLKDGVEVNEMVIRERFQICGQKARTKIRVSTNPLVKDTDKDGLGDGREVKGYVINQRVTFTRSGETFKIGKTRSNPTKADTDKDGLKDKVEKSGSANKAWQRRKTDPTKCDTDQGGARDGREIKVGSDPSRIKSGPNDLRTRMSRPAFG